jgi:hypothetical protein
MSKPAIILLGLLIVVGSALALMNNACKTGRHSWCAPERSTALHIRLGESLDKNGGLKVPGDYVAG